MSCCKACTLCLDTGIGSRNTVIFLINIAYIAYLLITLRVYIHVHVEDFGRGTRPCALRIRSLTRKTGALRTPPPHPPIAVSLFISSSHVPVEKIRDKSQFRKKSAQVLQLLSVQKYNFKWEQVHYS